ncbi:MAG: hypothetical protein A2048_01810 [Deltaproteobacteria bacterium GWA2_45_12]|nr:MAG: hypothetical protein A2048_01810 [Deltaproteobacteria bacterium GWA2_45_12]
MAPVIDTNIPQPAAEPAPPAADAPPPAPPTDAAAATTGADAAGSTPETPPPAAGSEGSADSDLDSIHTQTYTPEDANVTNADGTESHVPSSTSKNPAPPTPKIPVSQYLNPDGSVRDPNALFNSVQGLLNNGLEESQLLSAQCGETLSSTFQTNNEEEEKKLAARKARTRASSFQIKQTLQALKNVNPRGLSTEQKQILSEMMKDGQETLALITKNLATADTQSSAEKGRKDNKGLKDLWFKGAKSEVVVQAPKVPTVKAGDLAKHDDARANGYAKTSPKAEGKKPESPVKQALNSHRTAEEQVAQGKQRVASEAVKPNVKVVEQAVARYVATEKRLENKKKFGAREGLARTSKELRKAMNKGTAESAADTMQEGASGVASAFRRSQQNLFNDMICGGFTLCEDADENVENIGEREVVTLDKFVAQNGSRLDAALPVYEPKEVKADDSLRYVRGLERYVAQASYDYAPGNTEIYGGARGYSRNGAYLSQREREKENTFFMGHLQQTRPEMHA